MNKIKILLLIIIHSTLYAQDESKIIVGKNYYGKTINEREICNLVAFSTRPEVSMAIENIVKRSGLKQNFYVMECPNTDNCFAATRNGERLIVYDPAFMKKINNFTKTDWAALSILAHEIGHHLQGHTIKAGGSEHEKELEADEFSGFVMYQMGATLKEAQSAIFNLTSDYATSTHPARQKRMKAIEIGYKNAEELYPGININTNKIVKDTNKTPDKESNENEFETIVFDEIEIVKKTSTKPITGCIKGNCFEGEGTAVNAKSLEKYEGEWKLGKRHGYGKEYFNNGNMKYMGYFSNGKYNGNGTFYFTSGEKYVGNFYNGKMHGSKSTFFTKKGDQIIVDYINNKKEGKAKIIYWGGVEGTKYYKNDLEIK